MRTRVLVWWEDGCLRTRVLAWWEDGCVRTRVCLAAPHVVTDRAASRPKVLPGTVTGATFAIRLVNPFSDLYGVVNSYSLIVTTNPSDAGDIGAGGDDELATWASAQRDSNIVTYVAIDRCERLFQRGNGCWSGRARRAVGRGRRAMPGEAVSVTVGADGSCDVTATANVCNGALASGTDYYVKLRAYTASGFTDTPFSQPIHTTDGKASQTPHSRYTPLTVRLHRHTSQPIHTTDGKASQTHLTVDTHH